VVQGVENASSLGGLSATIGKRQGEIGIIVDGLVRDIEVSRSIGLPVWMKGTTPATGKWRIENGRGQCSRHHRWCSRYAR
jgi:regulator of RNase E activity RraA